MPTFIEAPYAKNPILHIMDSIPLPVKTLLISQSMLQV